MNSAINILITLDIHCYPYTEKKIPLWIQETLQLLDNLCIEATFFFPAVLAEKFSGYVRMILERGHEIACHGLTHGPEEQYNLMPYEKQKAILCEAKKRIEEVTANEVISFRSPAYKINGDTIKALEENGFRLDSSVNPQRLGILSSDITNIGWLYAPRRPYHPSFNNPFIAAKEGVLLWEIPQSAFILPFMVNTGIAFGGEFLKFFFRILYIESFFRKNPIVYMFHPEDIYPKRDAYNYKFEWEDLLPSKLRGFSIRKVLFHNKNPEKISSQIISLLKMMKESKDIKFITFRKMLDLFCARPSFSSREIKNKEKNPSTNLK